MRLSRLLSKNLALLACVACLAQEAKPPAQLSLEEVVTLVRKGLSEELVIARIKRYNKPFDLNGDEILELKKSGVSDNIIRYLFDPSLPYMPTPPPPPGPPADASASAPPKDPLMAKVPKEPGLYWLSSPEPGHETFEMTELKPVVPMKGRGKVGSMLTGGLKKGHALGFLVGPSAKLRVSKGPNVFYGRLGRTAIEDVVLLRMERGDGRRTLDFGPKPDKPVFVADAVRPFESKLLSEGFYRLEVPALPPGEYVLLILGSGDEKKGLLGKGFDFGN